MITQESTIAVLGTGTMGSGIATVTTRAGYRTILYDIDEGHLQRGVETIRGFLAKSAQLGKITEDHAADATGRIVATTELSDLRDVDVVIEAIYEDLDAKKDLVGQLDGIVGEQTLVHTNTSTLPVTAIASGSSRPQRVVGTHYCNPAPLMKLVEVADGRHTASWAHEATLQFLTSVGKTTVVTQDRPGFLVNRFLIPWENSCIHALEAGLGTIESIDAAVTGALGHPMGPFTLLDVVGLDIHQQVATRLYEQLRDARFFPPPLVDRMVAAGDLGRKAGRGFYTYDDNRLFGA